MSQTIFNKLEEILKKDERLVSDDGHLLKNKAVELANKLDESLVKNLFYNKEFKDIFFKNVAGLTLFDKDLFIEFVSNKEFLPDSYTSFKNKIGLSVDRNYLKQDKAVTLVWPYKDCVLEGGQTKEDAKRDEIFWNTTLAPDEINRLLEPKVLTNWKRYDKDNLKKGLKATEIRDTDNLVIKGNNLLALHSIKKRYWGTVKLIYIDPPYNTGKDSFKYNDGFNHSTWLTFMKNRLEIAKDLLREDGVIFVAIDDHEVGYLRILMDEIFGQNNFVQNFMWLHGKGKKDKNSRTLQQYNICYAKNKEKLEPWSEIAKIDYINLSNPDNDPRGDWFSGSISFSEDRSNKNNANFYEIKSPSGMKWQRQWQCTEDEMSSYLKDNRIYFGPKPQYDSVPRLKIFPGQESEIIPNNIFDDVGTTKSAQNELDLILGKKNSFDNPKPEKLLLKIIEMSTKEKDLVLDFFSGAGTTGAVAHKINRQYILVEQMDYIHDLPEERLKKVVDGDKFGISKEVGWKGGGNFVYVELMPLNEKFVREIEAAKSNKEVLKIWEAIQKNGFVSYRVDPKKFVENAKEFTNLDLAQQKKFVLESLDANMLFVNYADISDKEYGVGEEDKKLNDQFYDNASSRV